jgi:WD40 repeat protein
LLLWDLETGAGQPLEGHSGWVNGALLLPDGRRALSWSPDNTLRLWDLDSLRETARFVGDDPITFVAFSPRLQLALAGDQNGRMLFFHMPPRK